MDAVGVAQQRGAPRLVQRRPQAHAIVQGIEHHGRVVGEPLGRLARRPASGVLEHLGQVPVVQGEHGLDVGGAQLID
jgi:hypothetical protein